MEVTFFVSFCVVALAIFFVAVKLEDRRKRKFLQRIHPDNVRADLLYGTVVNRGGGWEPL